MGLVLAAPAQSSSTGQMPDPNAPITVPPDLQDQPLPAVPVSPPDKTWDRISGFQKIPEDEWTRHFRIGAIVGLNIKANFNVKGDFNISGNDATDGIYDDGFVGVDDTGNAQGYTTYWGYNNASQLNGTALTFTDTSSYSTTSHAEESGVFPGFELAYGGDLCAWRKTRIGWEFGFGLLPINITDDRPMSASLNQTVYTYSTVGLTEVPAAPYPGHFNSAGWPSISITNTSVSSTPDGTVMGSRTLDVMLYTFRLGPTLYWDLNESLALTVGAGPALGLVTGSLEYNETVNTVRNRGTIDGTDVVYGGYVNATLTYHVEDHGDLYVGVQYMPMGDATISGDGREGKLNLDGQVYITAGINWPF
jgi:hypothetical protein